MSAKFGLTLTTFEVNDGKHIVDQLLNRVVAPELLREVGTHVGPFSSGRAQTPMIPAGIYPGTCGQPVLAEPERSD